MSLSRVFFTCVCVVGLLTGVTPSWAQIAPYSQNFDGLGLADPAALSGDGWLAYTNVFSGAGVFIRGFPNAAPNGGEAYSGLVDDQGGPDQGPQQLSVFNNYTCCQDQGPQGHFNPPEKVEANVFQERLLTAADEGRTYLFRFDAKKGNIEGATTALAFIKTLDKKSGSFATLDFLTINTTGLPDTWGTFFTSFTVPAGYAGQLIQFGFANTASSFQGSGIVYDNVRFCEADIVIANDTINTAGTYGAATSATLGPDLVVGAADPGVTVGAPSVTFDGSNAGVAVGGTFRATNVDCAGD